MALHIPGRFKSPARCGIIAAALVAGASGAFARPLPSQCDRDVVGGRDSIIRLLDKDDNDIVIKTEDLPKAIRDYIAKEIPAGKITEARKDFKGNKERKGDNFTYEVDVKVEKKEYELKFSPDGKLLKKREEAGDEPAEKK